MPEKFESYNRLEKEVAELSRQIESKRRALAQERGIIEEEVSGKEAFKQVLLNDDLVIEEDEQNTSAEYSSVLDDFKSIDFETVSYWENLDQEIQLEVKTLIDLIFEKGLAYSLKAAKKNNIPIIIDTYHDILIKTLYNQLKSKGLVK